MMRTVFLLIIFSVVGLPGLLAGSWPVDQMPMKNNEANELYRQQRYQEALEKYQSLYEENSDDGALAYNLANTHAALGNTEAATEFYEKAIQSENAAAAARAQFNLGNLEMKQEKTREAVSRYIDYLKEHPDDLDAKRNLELALKKMAQQQQQQQQQSSDQNQDSENQEQQQQQQEQQQSGRQQDQQDQQSEQQQQQQQNAQESQDSKNSQAQQQQEQEQQQSGSESEKDEQQENQEQQSQKDGKEGEDEKEQKSGEPKEKGEEIPEDLKDQIFNALNEQEQKQQRAYQQRRSGAPKSRSKDW